MQTSATTAKSVDALSILNSIVSNTPGFIYAFDLAYRFTYAKVRLKNAQIGRA